MGQNAIFFDGWQPLLRTLIIAALAYPGMLLMVRLAGHRTLAQLNAFDLIVTVALGSTLSSVIVTRDVSLAQGLLAFALLILMQFALAWSARHSRRAETVLNGQPILLAHRGCVIPAALDATRITRDEVNAAVRSEGLAALESVEAVILETNGKLSVVRHPSDHPPTALRPVAHYPPESDPSDRPAPGEDNEPGKSPGSR